MKGTFLEKIIADSPAMAGRILGTALLLLLPLPALSVEELSVRGDFVVAPAKIELSLFPGETRTIQLTVVNRSGAPKRFQVAAEDFTAAREPGQVLVLLGDELSTRTLRNFLSFPEREFALEHGKRVTLPVVISLPPQIEPGGHFASVLVSMEPGDGASLGGKVSSGARLVARIGTLLFVTVPGDVKEEGKLKDFEVAGGKKFFFSPRIPFRMLSENTGSVHLNPYGGIKVKNLFGKTVGVAVVDPWFVLPDSLRTREITLSGNMVAGLYSAVLELNRGYGNIVDEKEVLFVVVRPEALIAFAALVILALVLLRKAFRRNRFHL
ncbi:hypothetical protein EPN83_02970 [Patescibacteria group bacterium]|nr:MAG: hypothetical protein EPN83_02970 [Patescibacteria group bacterium]